MGDNLFTCSIIALDADSGKMKWYFQFSPHETHDWDSSEPPILVDATIVVSAPAKVQRQRLLQRADLDEKKIDSLLARQMPDAEKRRRADFVVDTGVSIEASNASLDAIIARLRTWRGTAYQRCWA